MIFWNLTQTILEPLPEDFWAGFPISEEALKEKLEWIKSGEGRSVKKFKKFLIDL